MVGGCLVAFATALVMILNAVAKNRRESRKVRQEHERERKKIRQEHENEVIAGLERQFDRMEKQMAEYYQALKRVQEIHADCEVALTDCYGQLVRMHEWGTRTAAAVRAGGHDPGPDPPAPERPARQHPRQEVEFVVRTEAQGLAAARGVNERLVRGRQDPGGSGT